MFPKAEDDSNSGHRRPRVLVVDDDPVTLEVVRERLETLGYDVAVRSEPIGTAQWIAQEQPAFVLLDVSMPALSGTGLAQILGRNSSTRSTAAFIEPSSVTSSASVRQPAAARSSIDSRRRAVA